MIPSIPNSDERRRLWLYFLDLRLRYAVVVLLLGLVLVELLVGKALLLAGILWLSGALVLNARRPSDQEVDELLSRDLKSLVPKALAGLDPPEMLAAPLALSGPVERSATATGSLFVRPRAGRDGGLRSPVNHAVILVPMEDQLGIYSCEHDSLTGSTSQVAVEEHHYRDVVTVRLEEDVEVSASSGHDRRTAAPTQVFSLELTNGRRLSVPVSVAWQEESPGGERPLPTGLEKTVLAIRALMRDKR